MISASGESELGRSLAFRAGVCWGSPKAARRRSLWCWDGRRACLFMGKTSDWTQEPRFSWGPSSVIHQMCELSLFLDFPTAAVTSAVIPAEVHQSPWMACAFAPSGPEAHLPRVLPGSLASPSTQGRTGLCSWPHWINTSCGQARPLHSFHSELCSLKCL